MVVLLGNMKNSRPLIVLTLLALAFAGCSKKKELVADLGVIELAPNIPKHIKVGDVDWTITEKRFPGGKQTITAESAERTVTRKDISNATVPPTATVGTTIKSTIDLTDLPTNVETMGYFGGTMARYTLKHDAN